VDLFTSIAANRYCALLESNHNRRLTRPAHATLAARCAAYAMDAAYYLVVARRGVLNALFTPAAPDQPRVDAVGFTPRTPHKQS
jgi:hypothetical protein